MRTAALLHDLQHVARSNCLHLLLNLVNAHNHSLPRNTPRCKLHFQSSVRAPELTAIWFIQTHYACTEYMYVLHFSRIANGTGSNTCPYNFICRQCYQNAPSPVLMNNLLLSISLYISPVLLYSHTNFPRYCLHWVMFATAKFHHRSLSKLRSKRIFATACRLQPHPLCRARKNFLTKVRGHQYRY